MACPAPVDSFRAEYVIMPGSGIRNGAPSEDFAGYAKAVIDGMTIHVSGTLGQGEDGQPPDDAGQKARNALASIDKALKQAGSGLTDAVACRVYITDAAWLGEVFRDIRPTNTMLICQIPTQGAKVEIEITASRAG